MCVGVVYGVCVFVCVCVVGGERVGREEAVIEQLPVYKCVLPTSEICVVNLDSQDLSA